MRSVLALILFLPGMVWALPDQFLPALQKALDSDAAWQMEKVFVPSTLVLESEGKVSCRVRNGIVWQVEKPFARTIRLERDGLRMLVGGNLGGTPPGPLHKPPHYDRILDAVRDLSKGETSSIEHLFLLESLPTKEGWCIQLTPREALLGRVVKRAVLWGNELLERVEIIDPQGGRTSLRFTPKQNLGTEFGGE